MKGNFWQIIFVYLSTIFVTALLLTTSPVLAGLKYVQTTVTNNGLADGRYAVNDRGQVAWVGRVEGDDQIFLFSNGKNTQITANTANNIGIESLQINNLGQIAWDQYDYNPDGPGLNVNVYLYDGSTYKQLNNNQGQYDWYSQYPSSEQPGGSGLDSKLPASQRRLGRLPLTPGESTQRLTNDKDRQYPPRLNDSGWVTWAGDRQSIDDWDTRVYLYNGTYHPGHRLHLGPGVFRSADQ